VAWPDVTAGAPEPVAARGPLVLRATGLRRSLGRGAEAREVLRGIDLSIYAADFAALVGPSGSGKSTLLYLLGGLDRPDAGTVVIEGQDLAAVGDDELARLRNRLLGFVYQFHFLLPEFSALENVLMPLWARGAGRSREDRAWGLELLAQVGLADKATRLPRELSGGEQQRVAVARALVNRPRLLLADEPTGNLDTANARAVYELFREINATHGQTILVVTHDPEWAARSDRVLRLLDGELVGDEGKGGVA
jgi:lipoprotein-releasing system ATP-binding protein